MSSSEHKSKADLIESRRANLPLPDQPPQPSDFNSADARPTNVGSGGVSADLGSDALRGPNAITDAATNAATGDTAGMQSGRVPGGVPSDAVTKEKRGNEGLVETRGEDYGYPEKSDPSSGVK